MNPLRYLAPPRPFAEVPNSTKSEIEERINFADSIRLHPHWTAPDAQQDALLAYKEACQALLDLSNTPQTRQARESAAAQIADYDRLIGENGPVNLCFDLATRTKMSEELDNLHDMWAFRRYEKYLPATVLEEAPSHPSAKLVDPWHKAFWKPFNGRLEAEADAFAQVLSGGNSHNECPTFLLLALLCDQHTLDWDETVALIRYCGREDVEFPKADFADYVKARDTAGLAARLERDEHSISLSTEYVMGIGTMLLAYFRMQIPEALFEVKDTGAADWKPKKRLLDMMALEDGHEQAVRELIRDVFYEMVLGGSDDEMEEFDDEMDDDDSLEDLKKLGITD